jgi:hypothetical protein
MFSSKTAGEGKDFMFNPFPYCVMFGDEGGAVCIPDFLEEFPGMESLAKGELVLLFGTWK